MIGHHTRFREYDDSPPRRGPAFKKKLPCFVLFGGGSGSFGLGVGILAQPCLAKTRTMAPLNSVDILLKRAKNERFGVSKL